MTTTVTVKANHGWPVKVTARYLSGGDLVPAPTVAAGETRDFYVYANMDLLIHEVQPGEGEQQGEPKQSEPEPPTQISDRELSLAVLRDIATRFDNPASVKLEAARFLLGA